MKVAIIMGSDSDFPTLKQAVKILKDFDIPFDVHVISAHRSPQRAENFAKTAYEKGYGVLICAAGKAAHLAGVIAANTALPVIGLPIKSSTLDGLDSLLSTVQMPKGIPVATVAIDGSENAALLAIQILATGNENLYKKLIAYKKEMEIAIELKDAEIKKAVEEMK
ncbi:MAG: purE [Clostridia bacterium]|nr:purE [Clostridia bacterium]